MPPECSQKGNAVKPKSLQPLDGTSFEGDGAIEPDARAVDEEALFAVGCFDQPDVDLAESERPTLIQPPVGGQAQTKGVIVGRANRQNDQGTVWLFGPKQAVRHLMYRTVAARGSYRRASVESRLVGERFGMTGPIGWLEDDAARHVCLQILEPAFRPAPASARIIDDVDLLDRLGMPDDDLATGSHMLPASIAKNDPIHNARLYASTLMTYVGSASLPESAPCHGLLVIDKPPGITSRAALDRAAAWFPPDTRVGHAGTLDPLASGVLVLCLGKATRLVEFVQDLPKTYRARLLLGARSDTDDAAGVCVPVPDARVPDLSEISKALHGFEGKIQQVPPRYSAARHQGKRAYKLARKQHEFELAPRFVTVQQIAIETYAYPHLDLVIDCGKGTYIRSLARDLGECLGCGGLIAALRRTRIGTFDEATALKLDAKASSARERLLPLSAAVAHLPRLELPEPLVSRLCQGQRLAQTDIPNFQPESVSDLAVFDFAGELAVIVQFEPELERISPVKVMR